MLIGPLRFVFWILVIAALVFGFWFLPKYKYVQEHPDSCAQLTDNVYYCGKSAAVEKLLGLSNDIEARIKAEVRRRIEEELKK